MVYVTDFLLPSQPGSQ